MREWRNDAVLIVVGAVLGALLLATCLNMWPAPFGEFLYRWQTLVTGSFAVVAAVVAWWSTRSQISEMRRQFRHQMTVATERDRAAVDRLTESPLIDLDVIESTAHICIRHLERRDFAMAERYWHLFGDVRQTWDAWLNSSSSEVVTSLFSSEERRAIANLNTFLGIVDRMKDTLDDDSRGMMLRLLELSQVAGKAIRDVQQRVRSWVPAD